MKQCGWCEGPITDPRRRFFCSDTCQRRASVARRPGPPLRVAICDACGVEFDVPDRRGGVPRNCSLECMAISRRQRGAEWMARKRAALRRAAAAP